MDISEEQHKFIDDNLHKAGSGCSGIVATSDKNILSILLWNPLAGHDVALKCPAHDIHLHETEHWAHSKSFKSKSPRLLYDLNENVLLVSRLYVCSICAAEARYTHDSFFLAHHPEVMSQMPNLSIPPFHLFSHSGITRGAYEFIINLALAGTTFNEIEACFQRSHGFYIALHGEPDASNYLKHRSPSRRLITDVFMYDFRMRLPFYEAEMKSIKPESLSIDHTFKTRYGSMSHAQLSILFSQHNIFHFSAND